MPRSLAHALVCALAVVGCAKSVPPEMKGLQLDAAPAHLPIQLAVDFADALELIGARVEPTQGLKPGSRVELTLYWRLKGRVGRGFRLFTHVLDEAGERILNFDGNGPLRKTVAGQPLFPPSAWQEGKIYVDQQAFTVPANLRTDSITIVAGLFRDSERLPVTRGQHVSDRGVVAKLRVTRPTPVATNVVPTLWLPRRRAEWAVKIDGVLDDPMWSHSVSTGQLVNVGTGEPHGSDVAGTVRLMYDERALYLGFDIFDEDLRGGFDPAQADPHLWLKDTVEVMVDPDGDGDNRDYYEIQVNPQNLVFDSQFDSYNQPRTEPNGPFGHQEWSSAVESAVQLRGTLDDDKEDEGYIVEMAIPWSSFSKAKRTPPLPQDTWRMNFYAMQNNGGVAWSPVLGQGNFHKASRFGRIRFIR